MSELQRLICLMPLCAAACVQVNSQTQTRPQNDRRPLLFRGARVIVGDGRVIENAVFLVRDGLLMQVGTNADVTAPADAVVMDVRGKTVMPAIVNAHSHLGWEKYTSWGSRNFTRDNLIDHLYRHAYYGVGTVISTASDRESIALAVQLEQNRARHQGARPCTGRKRSQAPATRRRPAHHPRAERNR